jgi:anti-sigma B factor antagonist
MMSAFKGSTIAAAHLKNLIEHLSTVELELQIAPHENVVVVHCRGRLIYGREAAELIRALRQLLDSTKHVVLQMAEVTQIDSGGVGALGATFVAAHNREAEIKLAALPARVADVLRITGLELLFEVYGSETEAIEAFSRTNQQSATSLGIRE